MGTQAAKELKYGYGLYLPDESAEQRDKRESGLLKARCGCTTWTVIRRQIGDRCKACGRPILEVKAPTT